MSCRPGFAQIGDDTFGERRRVGRQSGLPYLKTDWYLLLTLSVLRGQQLQVKAVLTDPQLDIMIRGLRDTRRDNLSLDPKVTITRADGRQVAEGVMPFG